MQRVPERVCQYFVGNYYYTIRHPIMAPDATPRVAFKRSEFTGWPDGISHGEHMITELTDKTLAMTHCMVILHIA